MQSPVLAANAIFSQTTKQGREREGAGTEEVGPFDTYWDLEFKINCLARQPTEFPPPKNYTSRDSEHTRSRLLRNSV